MKDNKPFEIDNLDGYQFEELIAKIMKKKGYENIKVTPKSRDEGKDILMENLEGDLILVECKHQKFVGRPVIQKLQGAMNFEEMKNPNKEVKGMIVTSGGFSKEALDYNKKIGQSIELISGKKLRDICKKLDIFILNGKVQIITNNSFKNFTENEINDNILKRYSKIYGNKAHKISVKSQLKFIPSCFLKYNVNFNTSTSIGCVDNYSNSGKKAVHGITGDNLDDGVHDFYFSGNIDFEEIDKNKLINKQPYEFTENDIEEQTIESIIDEHTHNISYTGNNNVTYNKECIPKKRDIDIKKFVAIYLPFWSNSIKISKMSYNQNCYVKGNKQHHVEDELKKCKICKKERNDYEDMSLCPECGRIVCDNHVKIDYLDKKTPICTIHAKPLKLYIQNKYFATKENRNEYNEWWKSKKFFQKLWEDQIAFWLSIGGIILIFIFIISSFT
ncbi:restriction endonuclease [archaeon]|nr:restriction endonuclease [archaeon]